MIIAIDVLCINGKTTLSKMISDKLKFKNFGAGSVYRCIALEIINKNLDINDIQNVLKELENFDIDFIENKVILNNKDVTKEIKTPEITLKSTVWGAIPEIKVFVRKIQKDFIKKYDTVMEGRDICTRVAPDAEVKFYLYSDFEIRVQRALKDNPNLTIQEVSKNIKRIDDLDLNTGLFIMPENAIEIDTTNKTLDEVFEIMMTEINKKLV